MTLIYQVIVLFGKALSQGSSMPTRNVHALATIIPYYVTHGNRLTDGCLMYIFTKIRDNITYHCTSPASSAVSCFCVCDIARH